MSAQHTPGPPTCRHCGGKSGFTATVFYRALKVYEWNRSEIDTDRFEVLKEVSPKCMDCGKSARSTLAAIAKAGASK